MLTLLISARTTPDRPRAEAIRHLKTVHGPLVYDAPANAGPMPAIYVQNYVVDDLPLPADLESWRWDRHLVTEISFEDIGQLKASTATPYYLEHLRPDEPRFVDQSSVRPLVMTRAYVGEPGRAAWKLFVYMTAAGTEFRDRWTDAQNKAAPFCVAQAAGLPVGAPGAPPPFADGVWTLWFSTDAEARAFAADQLPKALEAFGAHLDPTQGRIVLAEQFDVSRLRLENLTPAKSAFSG